MAIEEPPLTRSELRAELREELDRTLRHYATKADLAALETHIIASMDSQTRWLTGLVLAAAAAAAGVVIAVDRLAV